MRWSLLRWQSDRDKTRVSSLNKRRVISVPEEGAASAEVETSGLDRSGAPLEVWTRRPPWVARPRSSFSWQRIRSYPFARWGCVLWLTMERLDCRPFTPASRARLSADNRDSPQSRSRWPASQRTSPGSEPSVESIYRLIDGRGRGARGHRGDSTLSLSDFSQAALTSSGTPHDDAIPVDRALLSRRLRALRERPRRPLRGVPDRGDAGR